MQVHFGPEPGVAGCAGRGLTGAPDSRKLKDCEGCGSGCILNRIIFPGTGPETGP